MQDLACVILLVLYDIILLVLYNIIYDLTRLSWTILPELFDDPRSDRVTLFDDYPRTDPVSWVILLVLFNDYPRTDPAFLGNPAGVVSCPKI